LNPLNLKGHRALQQTEAYLLVEKRLQNSDNDRHGIMHVKKVQNVHMQPVLQEGAALRAPL